MFVVVVFSGACLTLLSPRFGRGGRLRLGLWHMYCLSLCVCVLPVRVRPTATVLLASFRKLFFVSKFANFCHDLMQNNLS